MATPLARLEDGGMDAAGSPAGGTDASVAGATHRRRDSRRRRPRCIQRGCRRRAPGEEEEAAGMPLTPAVPSTMRGSCRGGRGSRQGPSAEQRASTRCGKAPEANGQPIAAAYSPQQRRRNEAAAYSTQQPSDVLAALDHGGARSSGRHSINRDGATFCINAIAHGSALCVAMRS